MIEQALSWFKLRTKISKSDIFKRYGKVVISALEKQIPKKPKVIFDEHNYFECGNCETAISCSDELKSHRYCLNCGQALDWSDTE